MGPYRSPNYLAKLLISSLQDVQKKGNYDDYYYHEYSPQTQQHLYRWQIDLSRRVFDLADGPMGIFWQDGIIWYQWRMSIWIRPSGLQSIFPDGSGTNVPYPNTSRKW